MFLIPEVAALLGSPGVQLSVLDQCRYGGRYQKGTVFMGNRSIEELRCDHPSVWWRVPWSGDSHNAPHPKLVGKQEAIPYGAWSPGMLRPREPHGDYLSRGAAGYPPKLNFMLAAAFASFVPAAVPRLLPSSAHSCPGGRALLPPPVGAGTPRGLFAGGLPEADKVTFSNLLRGAQDGGKRALRQHEDDECIGGMARTARCVAALPGNLVAGGQIRVLLDDFVAARPALVELCCKAIGSDVAEAGPSEEVLDERRLTCRSTTLAPWSMVTVRRRFAQSFSRRGRSEPAILVLELRSGSAVEPRRAFWKTLCLQGCSHCRANALKGSWTRRICATTWTGSRTTRASTRTQRCLHKLKTS